MVEAVDIKAEQVLVEQRAVTAMYERLDAERSDVVVARQALLASPAEGAEARYMRDAELARLVKAEQKLQGAERSLCFGRIDSSTRPSVHVGRIGLRSAGGEVLLVDWRAEAARPFYAATLAAPLGVRRRRHLRLQERQVVEVSDEILDGTAPGAADVVSDGPLISALSGARTGRMREAASTLQQEQDAIVRSAHQGVMVVDGGPGTGKTIVALHRAAYVLYAFPTIAERGVLVFGPNRRFLAYISEVLPSLGENNVEMSTTPDLVSVEATISESDVVSLSKGKQAFGEAIIRSVEAQQPQGIPLTLATAHGQVVLDASRVDAARRCALQGGRGHNKARDSFLEHIVDDAVTELEQQTAKEISDFEEDLREAGVDLDRMFRHRPGATVPGSPSDGLDIDWDLIREDLLVDPAIALTVSRVWPRLRAEEVLRGLLVDPEELVRALPDLSATHIESVILNAERGWSRADLAALDEARALIDGPPEAIYGHIVVDEAQQLSEMEWRMLMRRVPTRSMTIVGDLAQAGPTTTITCWEEALSPFMADRYEHHTLTINYRTTAEILSASAPVLARIAPSQQLSHSLRHGEQPIIRTATKATIDAVLRELLVELRKRFPDELIGIIAATPRAQKIEAGSLESRAVVVPAPDARGLEFDTVIIIDTEEIQDESAAGLRDLYVAQTRATKRLITITIAGTGHPLS
ncbi:AAA family ATPase [Arthrobacter sp.]|uniref:HelD family protein n=1 Tax=Arthrobacter sp. TaxID=1667 RepID=UPI002582EB29|nr:AAA family ATPase [Arthrobacter sp.]